ncbi:MAG TPA: type II secretion system F family protein [Candidatus Acidoferrales bacterium]|nr:type II secretion system F family protein [Candidatus Acidoferrales bacterium]
MIPLLFLMVLVITFVVVTVVLRPTKTEKAVDAHLQRIEGSHTVTADGTTILKEELLTNIPALYPMMRGNQICLAVLRLVKQAGSKWMVSSVMITSAVLAVVAGWLGALIADSAIFGILLVIAGGAAPYLYLYVQRGIRMARLESQLPEAVDLMARALRAGHPVPFAVEMVGQESPEPLASEFKMVSEQQTLGLPLREAILNLVQRVPREDVRMLATAILVQTETGGNLAQILDKTSALMRDRIRLRGQLRIYTAQGRITGWIICFLPFILFGIISLVNPGYEKILYTDPFGRNLIYTGAVLMTLGILIIRKIINVKI